MTVGSLSHKDLAETVKFTDWRKKSLSLSCERGSFLKLCLHVAFFSPFFGPFKNGFNGFLWCCSHMIKGATDKNGLKNATCKQCLTNIVKLYKLRPLRPVHTARPIILSYSDSDFLSDIGKKRVQHQ